MFVSAEIRWFWRLEPPKELDAWFKAGAWPPGGGRRRRDEYLLDRAQTELGLKTRGAREAVEVKGLVAVRAASPAPFAGRVQIWCKWSSDTLALDRLPRLAVEKTRWLRKYDTAGPGVVEVELDAGERVRHAPGRLLDRGCQCELVMLRAGDPEEEWWSFGLEAFGDLDTVEDSLRRTAAHLAATAPPLEGALELSYPAWLAHRFAAMHPS